MTEQNNATPGSNPRMWQGREIRNDMPIGATMATLPDHESNEDYVARIRRDSITTEPAESAQLKTRVVHDPGTGDIVAITPGDAVILGLSRVFDNFAELMSDPEPIRPTPGTVKQSLDTQKRNKAEQDRRARQREFVHRTHLTHRPFRAALADYNSKEKS